MATEDDKTTREFFERMGIDPGEPNDPRFDFSEQLRRQEAGVPIDELAARRARQQEQEVASEELTKRQAIDVILEHGPVLVVFDSTRSGVIVPSQLRQKTQVVLRFGYQLRPPIPDLVVDDAGVRGTLTFGGRPSFVSIPWSAVYAAQLDGDTHGVVWPEDAPSPFREQMMRALSKEPS